MIFTQWFASKGRHSHDIGYQEVWDAAQAEMKERCAKWAEWAEMWDSEPLSRQRFASGIRALDAVNQCAAAIRAIDTEDSPEYIARATEAYKEI